MWSARSKVALMIITSMVLISAMLVGFSEWIEIPDSSLTHQQRSWSQHSWGTLKLDLHSIIFGNSTSKTTSSNDSIAQQLIPDHADSYLSSKKKSFQSALTSWHGPVVGRSSCRTGIHLLTSDEQIPIIYIALNRPIQVASVTIPFVCERNDIVILLTNVGQSLPPEEAPCLRIHNVSSLMLQSESELPWPPGAPLVQRIFFTRWYVLRNWMQATGTRQVFSIDSDILLYRNVTALVRAYPAHFCKHSLWLEYEPPRASQGFLLITLDALLDVTRFWKHLLAPAVWTSEYMTSTNPNDMIAMGHYCHVAVGRPYPCWGYGHDHAPGTCDDTIAYGHAVVLARLAAAGVTAAYPPGPLSILADGSTPGGIGVVVDKNFKHDPVGIYDMSLGYKRVRYSAGVPQLRLSGGVWVEALGTVMEDELEGSAHIHMAHARSRITCVCTSLCCNRCPPE